MDDYLAKPVQVDKVASKLAHWLDGKAEAVAEAPPAATKPEKKKSEVLNQAALSELQDLIGDEIDVLFESFLDLIQSTKVAFSEALEQEDAPRVQATAHHLKSSARQCGADTLADIIIQVEQYAKAGDLASVESQKSSLFDALDEAASAVEALMKVKQA
jgi:HPt (histidine-containing phosphotransfer) domain-containing protein